MYSSAPPRPGELQGKPLPNSQLQPRLTQSSKIQLVGQVELGSAVGGPGHLPLTGGDADVVGEAGGSLKDPHAPWRDTGDL